MKKIVKMRVDTGANNDPVLRKQTKAIEILKNKLLYRRFSSTSILRAGANPSGFRSRNRNAF
jgi:hypothetical protein